MGCGSSSVGKWGAYQTERVCHTLLVFTVLIRFCYVAVGQVIAAMTPTIGITALMSLRSRSSQSSESFLPPLVCAFGWSGPRKWMYRSPHTHLAEGGGYQGEILSRTLVLQPLHGSGTNLVQRERPSDPYRSFAGRLVRTVSSRTTPPPVRA